MYCVDEEAELFQAIEAEAEPGDAAWANVDNLSCQCCPTRTNGSLNAGGPATRCIISCYTPRPRANMKHTADTGTDTISVDLASLARHALRKGLVEA